MLPRVAVTMGDPGGIGPEIVVKALNRSEISAAMRPLVVGDPEVIRSAAATAGNHAAVVHVRSVQEEGPPGCIPVICPPALEVGSSFALGRPAAQNGRAAFLCIEHACQLVLAGEADALCTAPISKEAVYAAGYEFPGHTELLARLCGDVPVRMMLAGGGLRVVLQTIHVPLQDVPGMITVEGLHESLRIMQSWGCKQFQRPPRMAVCGLNPHAGEAGHFGREEIEVIEPAVTEACREQMQVSGPYPADTIFHRMLEGEFDLVLAMYHDQALIPVKTLDFHGGVNITLGLPIIRTSPDHGTAFEIAGRCLAREDSMVAALLTAADLT